MTDHTDMAPAEEAAWDKWYGQSIAQSLRDRPTFKGEPKKPVYRSFEVAAVEVEGRTVDVRVVPFGEVARVADPPDWTPYEEEWLPGCFDHQLNAANRVHANYEHGKNITDVVGHGVSIRSEPDGYHITSVIHKTNAGDTALELLNGGALPGVSLEAVPVKNVRSDTGVMQRVKAHLRGFAFCREGAFSGAQVLAVRDQTLEKEQTLDAGMMPVDMDPELVQRLRALNVKLPDRYTAHPDQPDTPAQTGTSDDGTRQFAEHYVANNAAPTSKE